ncbi:uncharacterized protein (DUF1697 family) [Nocardiopsis sp. Huas11]|uniref:DUF1697 domain-containing protein n=1 Tax=Nocardiopsis sp. Huas11 TaxID=2183912 RepID=UPI000EB05F34|nr:DUF1697 domain-containing protein [Nocardiopsis sp. Huas11]RKS07742.1 uncharacterized protein (DUF1697 family) [Nocardiopsis sp. Huas11]
MTRYVALLRGVNVGGRRRLPMADLRDMLAGLGYTGVATYVQSGNAVLEAATDDGGAVAAAVSSAIRERFELDVPTVVRSAERMREVVAANPLEVPDPSRFLVLFATAPFDAGALRGLDPAAYPRERLAVGGTEAYTCHEEGIRFAKLPEVVGRHTAGTVTARNWRTVLRLLEMAEH